MDPQELKEYKEILLEVTKIILLDTLERTEMDETGQININSERIMDDSKFFADKYWDRLPK